jgi:F420-non-reducing hydrogenase iron-sulfur subunit
MLDDLGIEQERFRIEWISSAEAPRFAQIVRDFTEEIKKLGPNPYKT